MTRRSSPQDSDEPPRRAGGSPHRSRANAVGRLLFVAAGLAVVILLLVVVAQGGVDPSAHGRLDDGAATYVALARALAERDPLSGETDSGGIDVGQSVTGPRRTAAAAPDRLSFAAIAAQAQTTAATLEQAGLDNDAEALARRAGLVRDLRAIGLRAATLGGRTISFEEELEGLFGIAPLPTTGQRAEAIHVRLNGLLPGDGTLLDRFTRFEARYQVPADRLPAVFTRAIAGCRTRTVAHVTLPAAESIAIAYVRDAAWSGYSTYLGDFRSLIQVNARFPQSIDRLLDLACHEGYPGHHTSRVLRDVRLRRGPRRLELSILPTFTPDAFAAESAASQAAALAFAGADRVAFERDDLFPLAGFAAAEAERYVEVMRLVAQLDGAIAGAVQRYLAGELDVAEAGWVLEREALMAHPQALLMFVNRFRSYALAYVSGTTALTQARRDGASEDRLWARVVDPFDEE